MSYRSEDVEAVNDADYRDESDEETHPLAQTPQILPKDHSNTHENPLNKVRKSVSCLGRVWKLAALAVGLFLLYTVFRWILKSPYNIVGNMPKYGTGLGCEDAPHIYKDRIFNSRPISTTGPPHKLTVNIKGASVGTILLAESSTDRIEIEMLLRTNNSYFLDQTQAFQAQPFNTKHIFVLETPDYLLYPDDPYVSCMRSDIVIRIPPTVNSFALKSTSLLHIKFDEDTRLNLESLGIDLRRNSRNNVILPSRNIGAGRMNLHMEAGWLVGSVAFLNKSSIRLERDVQSKLDVFTLPASVDYFGEPAELSTWISGGNLDLTYFNNAKRVLSSIHRASGRDSNMYLRYENAGYNGHVQVKTRSWRSSGLHGSMPNQRGQLDRGKLPWAGNKDGADYMEVGSSGWAELSFT
ncbi:hypothetical protein M422DRAFT_257802 [Sphaerobolus stellatus SS14]|uniref:Adhesin domain-containing protein n=1 Tax=Sphaerobolus stellatus (strain SS14) TaxID=990650 RepID=A0A0C9VDK5_SPHS4|nr:hypothetical protein M422DRAFT_257802 [Sphaerobolus stellatus SS14]